MLAADVRDVESLDADRQAVHPERLLEGGHRVHALLPAPLASQPVLGERETCVPLGQLAEPAQVAALGDPYLDAPPRRVARASASSDARGRRASPATIRRGIAGAAE